MNKYKELTIKGYHFPDDTITTEWKGLFNSYIMRQYLPILNTLNYPEAIKRLALIMTRREGYLVPEDVMVFEGTLDEFLEIEEFKNYKIDNIL